MFHNRTFKSINQEKSQVLLVSMSDQYYEQYRRPAKYLCCIMCKVYFVHAFGGRRNNCLVDIDVNNMNTSTW